MSWGAVAGATIGAVGAYTSSKNNQKAAQAASGGNALDPRVQDMLFGKGPEKGLLAQYQGMLNTPRSDAANNFAKANEGYASYAGADMDASRQAAYRAMQGNQAPSFQSGGAQISGPAFATGNMVDAPGQNNLNLSGSYNSLINGAPGANPYLTGAIQKGINQSSNAFGNMLTDAKSATQDLLGNVRGGAIAAGQYGGSRQGLAEGKAIDSFNTNISRAASQFGQNNTDAAVAAQAGAYNSDRDRQLAATQGLSGQQYNVAQQNAATKNQAEFMNVNNHNNILQNNAQMQQQNNQFNASLGQQGQLATNAQNSSNNLAGAGLLSGLLGGASNQVNANDNWSLNRAQGVNGLLAPYLSMVPQQQPVYSSNAGAAIGGGLAGLQLGSSLGGLFGGSSGGGFGSMFGPGTIGSGI